MSRQIRRASSTIMMFLTPRAFASRERDDAGASAAGIRDHANRPPPQVRVAQLLDGSEESIKIKVKVFNRRWFSHGLQPDRVSHK
jgi:hypothetical protein